MRDILHAIDVQWVKKLDSKTIYKLVSSSLFDLNFLKKDENLLIYNLR